MTEMKAGKGTLVVISGFSGVGKGTVVKQLLEMFPNDYELSISATSRSPRNYEKNGREYHFLTKDEFEKMIEQDGLIEYTEYCGNYYGTPRRFLEETLEAGKNMILEIEVNGALNIRNMFPDALLLFMMPPTAEELVQRLSGRGTETEEVILARLERAVNESDSADQYDYIVVNDTPSQCAEEINALKNAVTGPTEEGALLLKEHRTDAAANEAFISQFRRELNTYLKQKC